MTVERPQWPFRSLLFVPAHKWEWIQKSPRFKPDGVILDLEDAVPPQDKAAARPIARKGLAFLAEQGIGGFIRINDLAKGGIDDVLEVTTPGLDGVLLPKLRTVEHVRELHDALSYAEGRADMPRNSVAIVLVPETAEGLTDLRQLAAASPRVKGALTAIISTPGGDDAALFTGDTALAAGFRPTQEGLEQIYLTSKLVLDSRAGGAPFPLAAMIGTDLGDIEGVKRLAKRARAFGFTGAVLIHPSHVAPANEAFTPTPNEVSFAKGVIDAMKAAEAAGSGAVRYRGMMIDYANLALAEQTIAEAERRARRNAAGGF